MQETAKTGIQATPNPEAGNNQGNQRRGLGQGRTLDTGALILGTNYVLDDEPALGLSEANFVSPDGHGWRRYQVIRIVRNDLIYEYREDLGSQDDWKGKGSLAIPGGVFQGKKIYIEHTVAELREYARLLREKPAFDTRELVGQDNIVQA